MARRIWPGSSEEHADRDHVLDLLDLVGRQQLYWTVDDLRRAMRKTPRLTLTHSRQLGRHVADLVPMTGRSVGQPVALFAEAASSTKTRHVYVLTERETEVETTPLELPDPARVYVTLWVACRAAGTEAVDTNAVTRVCRQIEELSVRDRVQMSTRLMQLVKRGQPLARKHPGEGAEQSPGSRWTRWQPIGAVPALAPLDDWVTIIREMEADRGPICSSGHVTLADLAREVVEIAIARTVSPAWPQGHPVTLNEHIAAARAEEPRARQLDELLRRRASDSGDALARVLADATKTSIVGRPRATQRIVKAGRVQGRQAYYDLPDREGYEARSLYVPYQRLTAMIEDRTFDAIHREAKAANQLRDRAAALTSRDASVIEAVACLRILLVQRELDAIDAETRVVEDRAHLLSQQIQQAWGRRLSKFRTLQRSVGVDTEEVTARADEVLRAIGLELAPIVAAPRPLLVGQEYAAWVPGARNRGRRPAELLADATTLRRFSNPDHTHRSDADPRRAAETGVDRVEALLGLAEMHGGATLAFLEGGAALLGRSLRHSSLPRLLLGAADERLRAQGLAALVLLGAPDAEEAALAMLAGAQHDVRTAERALQALAVLGKAEPQLWPAWLKETREPSLVRHMQALLNLPADCRWLMRRV